MDAPYNFVKIANNGGREALKATLIQRGAVEVALTQRAGIAATLALSDGPLPFGDMAAALLLAYTLWEASKIAKDNGIYNPAWDNYVNNSEYNASMKDTFETQIENIFIVPNDNRATTLPHILDNKYFDEVPVVGGIEATNQNKENVIIFPIPEANKPVDIGGIQAIAEKDPIFIHFPVPKDRDLNDFVRFILAGFERDSSPDGLYEIYLVGKKNEDLGSMTIKSDKTLITLEYLYIKEVYRGKGLAGNALDKFCAIAEEAGEDTQIRLRASPTGDKSLSVDKLIDFYSKKLGLEVEEYITRGSEVTGANMVGTVMENESIEEGTKRYAESNFYDERY